MRSESLVEDREEALTVFENKLRKIKSEKARRSFLLGLLLRYKVDRSLTRRTSIKNAGKLKYRSARSCEVWSKRRNQGKGMLGETYVWKPVGRDLRNENGGSNEYRSDFLDMLGDNKMPWMARSDEGVAEKKALYGLFLDIFVKHREGVFVSIRDNRMTHWVPFFNLEYVKNLSNVDFSKVPKGRRVPGKKSDWLVEWCYIVDKYRRTEVGMAEYYDMIVEACRRGKLEDVDFFINMKRSPIMKSDESTRVVKEARDKFGIFVLSGTTMEGYDDVAIPTPEEWSFVTKGVYPLTCGNPGGDKYEKRWSKKKNEVVYRDTVSGCYSTEPLSEFMLSRVELVKLLRKYKDGVDAALQGVAKPTLRKRGIGRGKEGAYLWPSVIDVHEGDSAVKGLTEVEYDPMLYNTKYRWILKRSGNEKEQREVMEKILYGGKRWWPWDVGYKMEIPTTVPPSGSLAGGALYDWVVYKYYNLQNARNDLELKKSMYENRGWDSPRSSSPEYKPGSSFGVGNFRKVNIRPGVVRKSELDNLAGIVENMEKDFEQALKKGNKEKAYLIGRGAVKYARIISKYKKLEAREPEGMIGREGLRGLRSYWKKNKVAGKDERKEILEKVKEAGVVGEYKSLEEQSKYKFVLVYNDIPGVHNYYLKASMGSALMVFKKGKEEVKKHWLLDDLEPWVHYIPVKRENFEEMYKWCIRWSESKRVKKIVENLNTFMERRYNKDGMLDYVGTLSEISNLIIKKNIVYK